MSHQQLWLNRSSKKILMDWLKSPNGASPNVTDAHGLHHVWLEAVEGGGIVIRWSKKL